MILSSLGEASKSLSLVSRPTKFPSGFVNAVRNNNNNNNKNVIDDTAPVTQFRRVDSGYGFLGIFVSDQPFDDT